MWSLLYLSNALNISDFNQISIRGKISQDSMIKTLQNEQYIFKLAKRIFPQLNKIYIKKCRQSKNSQCCKNLLSFINKT